MKQLLFSLITFSCLIFYGYDAKSQQYQGFWTYWHQGRGDNFLVGPDDVSRAEKEGYQKAYFEGYISSTKIKNTTALYLYYSDIRGDYISVASAQGVADAQSAGYTFIRIQGYIWTKQISQNQMPLNLYYSDEREDNITCASSIGNQAARDAKYRFARTEGYIRK